MHVILMKKIFNEQLKNHKKHGNKKGCFVNNAKGFNLHPL